MGPVGLLPISSGLAPATSRTPCCGVTIKATSGDPLVVPLPVSGLVTATLSIEPTNGDGGTGPTPATLTLSVESKSNADPANPDDRNFCYAAGQVLQAG